MRYWLAAALLAIASLCVGFWIQPQPERPGKSPASGDDFAIRYTYPTFQFDGRWLNAARKDFQRIEKRIPMAAKSAETLKGTEFLPAGEFTFLGPRPLTNGDLRNGGRINVVLAHPE